MDIVARRLWIIRQILATTDEALLQKIEYLLLMNNNNAQDGVKEPQEHYTSEQDFKDLPEEVKEEILKLTAGAI